VCRSLTLKTTPMEDDLKILNVEYLSNRLKLRLMGPTRVYRSLKVKMTPMEDNLKIINVEYLTKHWSNLIQIFNLR
jgi:hypothetical protein